MYKSEEVKAVRVIWGIIVGVLLLTFLIILWMIVGPHYRVYKLGLHGEALLREAESSRKVAVEEAKAKKDSAIFLAEAEVERAKGVAQANAIIADGLKGHEEYLRYLWIKNLEDHANEQIIYIPTEAGLPILEAGRLNRK